jgi:GNAT superfamily N-acetyltransferase
MYHSEIILKLADSSNEDFKSLVVQLDKGLYDRYQSGQAQYEKYNRLESINTVVVAYDKEEPVGCGAYKVYDKQTVEMKRMFVAESHRGRGISKMILKELEAKAREAGFTKSVLETGIKQHEAMGLYNKAGYTLTENYGQYKGMPLSICFEKKTNQLINRKN